MTPGEPLLSARQVRAKLATLRGKATMHAYTLARAIRQNGLPSHPNPFGRGQAFFWSEVEAWLSDLRPVSSEPIRRGPGRPRKN